MLFSSDVSGLTKKAFTQVQKLATIYAAARETTNYLFPLEKSFEANEQVHNHIDEDETEMDVPGPSRKPDNTAKVACGIPAVEYIVKKIDVEAAYDFVKQSMLTFRSFKVLPIYQKQMYDFFLNQMSLGAEMGDIDKDGPQEVNAISEELILGGVAKIRKIYEKADENMQVTSTFTLPNSYLQFLCISRFTCQFSSEGSSTPRKWAQMSLYRFN